MYVSLIYNGDKGYNHDEVCSAKRLKGLLKPITNKILFALFSSQDKFTIHRVIFTIKNKKSLRHIQHKYMYLHISRSD